MKPHFYSHLVRYEEINFEIENLDIKSHEKEHLKNLVISSLHHAVLDLILSELAEEEKKMFLNEVKKDNHNSIWKFINNKMHDSAWKIEQMSQQLVMEFMADVKKLSTKK